jgi:hypothetical protein
MKYQIKFKNNGKTYFADVFADNESEATAAIKTAIPGAFDIKIKDNSEWRKARDEYFNTRWFYLAYALLFIALCFLIFG